MYVKHFEGLFGTDALAEMVAASWWLLNTQMQGTSSETILCVKSSFNSNDWYIYNFVLNTSKGLSFFLQLFRNIVAFILLWCFKTIRLAFDEITTYTEIAF